MGFGAVRVPLGFTLYRHFTYSILPSETKGVDLVQVLFGTDIGRIDDKEGDMGIKWPKCGDPGKVGCPEKVPRDRG